MTEHTDDDAERDARRDRRPRLRTRYVIPIVLVLLVGASYRFWSSSRRERLDQQIAAYRARGEPVEPADFAGARLADEDNAVVLLRQATRIDTATDAWKAYEAIPTHFVYPLSEAEVASLRPVLADNAGSFDKVDQAMRAKGINWNIPLDRSPVIQVLLPDLNPQRQLAMLIVRRAKLNHQQGDDAAALADLRRATFIGRALDHQPFLISHLVSVAVTHHVADALAEIAPDLKLQAGSPGAAPGTAASPRDLAEIIAMLNDDGPQRAGQRNAILGERMAQLDTARCVADGTLSINNLRGGGGGRAPLAALVGVAYRAAALDDALIMLKHTTAVLEAREASPDWPTFKTKTPPYPAAVSQSTVRYMVARRMLPTFDRAALTDYRATANRRLAATALAIRAYAADHGGAVPPKLADLVPRYLPAVPADPLAANAQPLRYDPAKQTVYSVSENGIDDGGSTAPIKQAGPNDKPSKWDRLDAVIDLKPATRPAGADARPATQP